MMGYPMTWQRFIRRNGLAEGGYENKAPLPLTGGLMRGDARRLEEDALIPPTPDATALNPGLWRGLPAEIAKRAGVDVEVTLKVLRAFFTMGFYGPDEWQPRGGWPDQSRIARNVEEQS